MKISEYKEKCGCGRIVITERQANGHAQHCEQMPDDSQLLSERFTND